ncbi:BLOC-2 complex member HPS5 homolog isoform X2 [Euwallacea fornicatus]|uniref:BLOC-2 complex member HPS5 homolog isoform X2 n=1 Tax=Euwallacea fornicatus TaxID=995702 RepID=UPI00338FE801
MCFSASPSFLVFGATSGGVYIFKRKPCAFLKLIPSKEGSADLIAISQDEKLMGVATSRGLILVLQNFIEDPNFHYQIFSQHEGRHITFIKCHKHQLYIGDDKGRVSMVSADTALFQTKSMFQMPAAILMTLDSCIVQIDCFQCYLLISTRTKTYLCNTEKEFFVQIGKKAREGCYGACFLTTEDLSKGAHNNLVQSSGNPFRSATEEEILTSNSDSNKNIKIFCARPGARLWEVSFNEAKVLFTYQFKSALTNAPSDLPVIGNGEESVLQMRLHEPTEKIPDTFTFQNLFPVCDRFVLTVDSSRLYIFDPSANELAFWLSFENGIKCVVSTSDNHLYIWKNDFQIVHLSVVELEQLLLATLYKKQFYLCTDICLQYKAELLKLLEKSSKKLYLLSALKSRIGSAEILQQMQPILERIQESNEKLLTTRPQKANIVLVENLHCNLSLHHMEKQILKEDLNKDLKLILKQYKLNKTHGTVEIPEVTNLLQAIDHEDVFAIFKRFRTFVEADFAEDATKWCQQQYLKQISKRDLPLKNLTEECFNFVADALFTENMSHQNYSCSCGYPLPECQKHSLKFHKTALDLLETKRDTEKILKNLPYLWRYAIKTEIYGLNMIALIQYNDLTLLREHTAELTYDSWHDVLSYFIKINKGICLNCDRKINVSSLITWSDLSKLIVQSLGSKNTIRILQKYQKTIPSGALDATFYQTCIFSHTFVNDSNYSLLIVKPQDPVEFLERLKDSCDYKQFQDTMAKYFKRKYAASRNPCYTVCADSTGLCPACNLPLKNDILIESETAKRCGHKFHKFCFIKEGQECSICN